MSLSWKLSHTLMTAHNALMKAVQVWLAFKTLCCSPCLPGGRSAAGELAGRSPGCGCWGRLLCVGAAAVSPPGGGYHGDQLPCAKLCDHAPMRKRDLPHDSDFIVRYVYSIYL